LKEKQFDQNGGNRSGTSSVDFFMLLHIFLISYAVLFLLIPSLPAVSALFPPLAS